MCRFSSSKPHISFIVPETMSMKAKIGDLKVPENRSMFSMFSLKVLILITFLQALDC